MTGEFVTAVRIPLVEIVVLNICCPQFFSCRTFASTVKSCQINSFYTKKWQFHSSKKELILIRFSLTRELSFLKDLISLLIYGIPFWTLHPRRNSSYQNKTYPSPSNHLHFCFVLSWSYNQCSTNELKKNKKALKDWGNRYHQHSSSQKKRQHAMPGRHTVEEN